MMALFFFMVIGYRRKDFVDDSDCEVEQVAGWSTIWTVMIDRAITCPTPFSEHFTKMRSTIADTAWRLFEGTEMSEQAIHDRSEFS
jgi:hypothetical protein